ncbi:hypothetical protein O3M35_008390 [Rhynocoris fuscipes]|uniref:Scavenger receptor class B member 1 n=1 Tax=Rhynocoris fuscipes TaxID=488301 RepID=A0AAW1D7D0_9HEMI
MMKGLPAYDWWQSPPDEVLLKAHVFNVTNSEDFMRGRNDKLIIKEVGPYIFREKLYHTNVTFNDNGTLTYTATRKVIFLPEMNTLSLNETIIAPNLAVLAASSYLYDAPFITKMAFNMILNRFNSEPFVPISVYDYFWNFTDPVLKVGRSVAPSLVPAENMGILNQIYQDFTDVVTVYVGVKSGPRNFFKITKYNGNNGLNAWENKTCDSVQGSSEGVSYHQNVYKNDTIKYLRKTICRALPLYYSEEIQMYGMTGYKFDLPNNSFARPDNPDEECYRDPAYPILPSGLSDVSPCYFNLPIASSFPHLMYADPILTKNLEGLAPDWDKHGSAAIIEPNSGVPFTAWARSQSNIYMHSMSGFPRLKKFSNMAIPMFWLEYVSIIMRTIIYITT